MSLALSARIARRELRGGVRGFRVFLACLALGIAAIAAVGTVRESINQGLQREGASILGGDASIELTYQFMPDAGRQWLTDLGDVSEIVDFRSMAVVDRDGVAERALTQIKAVDAAYPLYGAVTLEPEMPLERAFDGQDGVPGAVMDRILVDRLGLTPGDLFRLGTKDFVLMATLTGEPDSGAGGFGLGPRTLLRTTALDGSGLLQPGTLFETEYRLRLPPETDLDALEIRAKAELTDFGFRWRDRRNGSPGLSRFVEQLSAFLVLVGLAGLAVGGVGVASAVRAHLERKTGVIATLKTLGAEGRMIFQIYLIQIGVLTAIGVAIGVTLGALAPLAFAPLISARLPVPTAFAVYPVPLLEAALYGTLTALLFTLWPLARTERIRAAALYRDLSGPQGWPRPVFIVILVAILAALVGLAAWLSGLVWLTVSAALGLGAAFVMLLGAAALVRRLARWGAQRQVMRGKTALRLALGAVGGPGGDAASVVLSLGLGLTVLAAVGQIDSNLRGAIQRDLPDVAPSYFMVDIQPDQLDGFLTRLKDDPGVSKVQTAPMLRGIITQINGRDAIEVADDHWVVRGDRGITYSAEPGPDTTITAGEFWPKDYTGDPQVSFAAEEAAEIGLKLGDTVTVNILGRDISATITSFREVDFSTAGIGFVMALNPTALQGAPHTHIATIYADEASEAPILRDLASAYPNITAIRVRDAIDRITVILGGIAAAITYGALATLVTGGVVLIGAAAAGERARTYEAAVLKTLGASRKTILISFALRSAILGAAAGLVAIVAGGLAGWGVSRFVMETDYTFEPISALLIIVGGVLVTLIAGLAFAWRPLAARPARVLRGAE